MKKNTGTVIFVIITVVQVACGFDASQGNIWTGGAFSFQSMGAKNKNYDFDIDRMNMLMLSPTLRLFPVSHFCIGPAFNWMGIFSGGDNMNFFGVGGEIGFVGFAGGTAPYVLVSPGAQIINGSGASSQSIFELPFSAGLIIPIDKNIGFQLEAGLTFGFDEDVTTNTISFGIGVCGLGERTAVSVLSKFMPLF